MKETAKQENGIEKIKEKLYLSKLKGAERSLVSLLYSFDQEQKYPTFRKNKSVSNLFKYYIGPVCIGLMLKDLEGYVAAKGSEISEEITLSDLKETKKLNNIKERYSYPSWNQEYNDWLTESHKFVAKFIKAHKEILSDMDRIAPGDISYLLMHNSDTLSEIFQLILQSDNHRVDTYISDYFKSDDSFHYSSMKDIVTKIIPLSIQELSVVAAKQRPSFMRIQEVQDPDTGRRLIAKSTMNSFYDYYPLLMSGKMTQTQMLVLFAKAVAVSYE